MAKLDAEHRNDLSSSTFAFPKQRKEPLENASHVRNAIARFDQVEGVTDEERNEAWTRIKTAAKIWGRGPRRELARAREGQRALTLLRRILRYNLATSHCNLATSHCKAG